MDTVVVDNHTDAPDPGGRVCLVQPREERPKQPVIFAEAKAVHDLPCREIERAGSIVRGILPRGHHSLPDAFRYPGLADFG